MAILVDVRPKYPPPLSPPCMVLIFASDDIMPESHVSHISEHEILEYEHISQPRQRRKRRIKAYRLDTNQEPPVYAEVNSTFCDD